MKNRRTRTPAKVPWARVSIRWLLALVPVSVVAELGHQPLLAFGASALAIIPLAGLIGSSTDQIAVRAGPRLGGLLNATFGNLTELIVSITLILAGEVEVVKASLVGSILGNLLLVLGLSFLAGGLRHKEQHFNARAAGVHSASLVLAVAGLLMPALFVASSSGGRSAPLEREVISLVVAFVLIALYLAALAFTHVTHAHLFPVPESGERPSWSLRRATVVLALAAAFVGLESEILVSSLEPAIQGAGLSKLFVGLIVIPLIGNAAEHSSAILFSLRDKTDVTLEIAIGSSTQIALFVAPAVVFISLFAGHPMDFVFTGFQVATAGLATVIVSVIALDGRTNWLEGAQLIGAYMIVAVSAFFLKPAG